MQWGVCALNESLLRKNTEAVDSTFGVELGCSLFPTLLCLYVDEVLHCIERFGGSGGMRRGYTYTNITRC